MFVGRLLSVCFLLFICGQLRTAAQSDLMAVGARQAALGYTTQTHIDAFSVFNNQAQLGRLEDLSIGLYAQNHFLIADINLFGLALALPTSSGTFGLGIQRYGNADLAQSRLKLAYGRSLLENLDIGAEFEVGSLQIDEYGSRYTFTFGLALAYDLTESLRLGARVYNPLRIQLTDDDLDRLSSLLTAGLVYQPSERIAVHLEFEKNLDFDLAMRTGLDYQIADRFALRVGYAANPTLVTAGFGLALGSLNIDIAGSWRPALGYTPQLGLLYHKAPTP